MFSLNCHHSLRLIVGLSMVGLVSSHSLSAQNVIYSNDFDGNVVAAPGIVVSITGGTDMAGDGELGGVVSSQAYDSEPGFGGDFWRVTAPDDVLQFHVNNTPVGNLGTIEFSLAIIDSWDGAVAAPNGPDRLEIEILDGANQAVMWQESISGGATPTSNATNLVSNKQLGFNASSAATWWWDDGYHMVFDNIPMNGGSLTFRIVGTGDGYNGGLDESFAIDNLLITAIPEPSVAMFGLALGCVLAVRRRRRN